MGLAIPDAAWVPGSWTLVDAFSKTELAMGWSPSELILKASNSIQTNSSFSENHLPVLKASEMSVFLNATGSNPSMAGGNKMSKALLIQTIFYNVCRGVALKEYSGKPYYCH